MILTHNAISFAGCGTLNFYQVGVLAALQEQRLDGTLKYAGASAGAGLCVLAAAGIPAMEIGRIAEALLKKHAKKNIVTHYRIPIYFGRHFLRYFKSDIDLEKINGRIGLSITQIKPYQNLLVSHFASLDEVFSAVRASCHLPSFRYPYVRFRGAACIDGGVSWNNPVLGNKCLRISPLWMDRRADVTPSERISPWWGFHVPPPDLIWRLVELGKKDCLSYLQSENQQVEAPVGQKRFLKRLRGRQVGL